jgi:AraC-like DNA-binding protein
MVDHDGRPTGGLRRQQLDRHPQDELNDCIGHTPLSMEELASDAHMSPSTFRHRFRQIAGMSPLQYQKQLRLQEARSLMLNEQLDASVAGIRVGYESVSQFNREYSRLFGVPPLRDIKRLRVHT